MCVFLCIPILKGSQIVLILLPIFYNNLKIGASVNFMV